MARQERYVYKTVQLNSDEVSQRLDAVIDKYADEGWRLTGMVNRYDGNWPKGATIVFERPYEGSEKQYYDRQNRDYEPIASRLPRL